MLLSNFGLDRVFFSLAIPSRFPILAHPQPGIFVSIDGKEGNRFVPLQIRALPGNGKACTAVIKFCYFEEFCVAADHLRQLISRCQMRSGRRNETMSSWVETIGQFVHSVAFTKVALEP